MADTPIDRSKADQTNLAAMDATFGKYGRVTPYPNGKFVVTLIVGSDLAERLRPFTPDPNGKFAHPETNDKGEAVLDKTGKPIIHRNNASLQDWNNLDDAMGKTTTPSLHPGKDAQGRITITVFGADLDKFSQDDLQRAFDGMLSHLNVPKKTSNLEFPTTVALAARDAANGKNLNPAKPGTPDGHRVTGVPLVPATRTV